MKQQTSRDTQTCWTNDRWPTTDQILWAKACEPSSIFDDDGGGLLHLAPVSVRKYAYGHGRWTAFLDHHDRAALDLSPALRCTKPNVQAYIDHLRAAGNADWTIINRLYELVGATKALDPSFNPQLINRFISVLKAKAKPVRNKSHIPPANELVDLGFRLMKSASDPGIREHKLAFLDGLLITFLALHPVRRRNLLNFHLEKNLIRQGDGYMLVFAGSETKSGNHYEAPLAEVLVEPMNQYLTIWRPALMSRVTRRSRTVGTSVWVTTVGSPMSSNGIAGRFEKRTREAFGKAINIHAFRDAAATTLVIADPARVRAAAPLLGHRSLATTEKHYIRAEGLSAQRTYLQVLEALRKEKSHG